MKKLIALSNVDHDGKRYEPGDALEVDDEHQAEALVKAGVAEAKGAKPKPKAEPDPAPEPDPEA